MILSYFLLKCSHATGDIFNKPSFVFALQAETLPDPSLGDSPGG